MKTIKQLLMTVAVLLCNMAANAHDFEVDGIYYNIVSATDLTVGVTCKGDYSDDYANEYTGNVIIPSTVTYGTKALTVVSIDYEAFKDCSELTSLTIPNSVTSIGNGAFNGCTSLTELYIEDGAETLSLGCNNYSSLYPSEGRGLFYSCPLRTLYLGRNLSYETDYEHGRSPFYSIYKNKRLKSVTIGDSVTSIGLNMFNSCEGLTAVHINDLSAWCNIKFSEYQSNPLYYAKKIYLNNELITDLVIPETVTEIKYIAFYGCTHLRSVTIPNSVTSIGNEAFSGCSELTSLTIPNSVINIGKRAFYRCYGLRSVTIPNSVTSIGEDAFMDCNGLTRVELDCSEIGHWFYSLAVDDSAPIKEFVFGNNVTSIKQRFSYFKQLTSIYLLGKTPPSIENDRFMESQYVKTTLYVPQGSLETFQSADTWKNFWDIREHNMTGINEISAGDITIEATANGISVLGAEGNTIVIHAANGTRVVNIDSYVGEEITLDRGVYIVRVGSNTLKVKL